MPPLSSQSPFIGDTALTHHGSCCRDNTMRTVLLIAMFCVATAVFQAKEVQELADDSVANPTADELKAECLAKDQAQMKAHCISKTTEAQCGWAAAANMHDW
jgi:hypothetical protein